MQQDSGGGEKRTNGKEERVGRKGKRIWSRNWEEQRRGKSGTRKEEEELGRAIGSWNGKK